MALTCSAIAAAIVEALRADSNIMAKCLDYYGRTPAVYRSASGPKAPENEYFPAFTVLAWGKTAGENDPVKEWDLSVMLELNEANEEVGSEADNRDYLGADRLEELLDLVLAAIRGVSEELFLSRIDFSYEPVEFFPVFVGVLAFTVSFPAVMGGYEPSL
jgi:hypothetical protein